LEGDNTSLLADLEESRANLLGANDRADRLSNENKRLHDELSMEQNNYRNAESLRKQLEIEIREISVRLEEAESFAAREGKRIIAKLQSRVRDLEAELEAEQRRHREASAAARKFERQLKEIMVQSDEDRRMITDLTEQVAMLTQKIKVYKRQVEEAEEVTSITLNKYRKLQAVLEEAESRADQAERSAIASRSRARSTSVHREVVKIIKA